MFRGSTSSILPSTDQHTHAGKLPKAGTRMSGGESVPEEFEAQKEASCGCGDPGENSRRRNQRSNGSKGQLR